MYWWTLVVAMAWCCALLPVVVHGDKAWWNIASNAALAAELKSRGAGAAVAVAEVAAAAAAATY